MKVLHGASSELTQEQRVTITRLEERHGEAYVTPFEWGAYATFENGTEDGVVHCISLAGEVTP